MFKGSLQNHKWENAFTVDRKSWGFRKTMSLNDTLTTKELLHQVVSTVSCGGKLKTYISLLTNITLYMLIYLHVKLKLNFFYLRLIISQPQFFEKIAKKIISGNVLGDLIADSH